MVLVNGVLVLMAAGGGGEKEIVVLVQRGSFLLSLPLKTHLWEVF